MRNVTKNQEQNLNRLWEREVLEIIRNNEPGKAENRKCAVLRQLLNSQLGLVCACALLQVHAQVCALQFLSLLYRNCRFHTNGFSFYLDDSSGYNAYLEIPL